MSKVVGTSVEEGRRHQTTIRDIDVARQEAVDRANALVREAYELLEGQDVLRKDMPVGKVQWIHISRVQANDYNPNSVAGEEMRLLHTSIASDGYTMPIVTMYDEEIDRYIIVDGFHRYTTMRRFQDVADSTNGYIPLVVIDKPIEDRIASTVRHNRARGKHSVAGMGQLVFQMLEQGESDVTICDKLGVDADELVRLKHITGYSKLYAEQPFGEVYIGGSQLKAKAEYKREHPEEAVPSW